MKNPLDKLKANKDSGVLIANLGYLTLLQVAGYVFPLITIPYLARVIGVDNFGKIAFASAIMVWIMTISDWGFDYTATRDVSRIRNDKEKVSEIFSNVLYARIFLMVASFILLLIAVYTIPTFKENQEVILISFLIIPGHVMFPQWIFQAMERMKYITILNVLSKLLFTLCVFVFIKEKSDYLLQPVFTGLGFLISGVIAMYIILIKWEIRLNLPKFSRIIMTIKENTDVFLNNFMPNLYNSFSVMLLGFLNGTVANGLLDAGNKFVAVGHQFMTVMSKAFFPFLSRKLYNHYIYARIHLSAAILLTCVLFFGAPFIIQIFFTPDFNQSVPVLRILSLSIVFLSLSNIYGTNYMIIQGHEKQLRNITFVSSMIGLCMSFPLIYFYSYTGAAVTITISRTILGLAIMFSAQRMKKQLKIDAK